MRGRRCSGGIKVAIFFSFAKLLDRRQKKATKNRSTLKHFIDFCFYDKADINTINAEKTRRLLHR